MSGTDPLAGWVPFFLSRGAGGVFVEWGYMGERRFVEPFFHQTMTGLMRRPFNEVFRRRTPIETLLERAPSLPGLPPAGFVFHMSRCGSTLAAQALASLTDSVVLSEAEPLDTLFGLLNEDAALSEDRRLALVRGLTSALGQPRRNADRRLFIKLDAWHIAWADLLLRAFADTPWIFLYRNPVEVLVSHQRQPGSQLIPGTLHASFVVPEQEVAMAYQPVEYGARVFSAILHAAERAMTTFPNGRLVNYRELPDALWTTVADHFHLDLSPAERLTMEEIARHDAKWPAHPFRSDTAGKRHSATPDSLELARRWLDVPYRRLETLRLETSATRI